MKNPARTNPTRGVIGGVSPGGDALPEFVGEERHTCLLLLLETKEPYFPRFIFVSDPRVPDVPPLDEPFLLLGAPADHSHGLILVWGIHWVSPVDEYELHLSPKAFGDFLLVSEEVLAEPLLLAGVIVFSVFYDPVPLHDIFAVIEDLDDLEVEVADSEVLELLVHYILRRFACTLTQNRPPVMSIIGTV